MHGSITIKWKISYVNQNETTYWRIPCLDVTLFRLCFRDLWPERDIAVAYFAGQYSHWKGLKTKQMFWDQLKLLNNTVGNQILGSKNPDPSVVPSNKIVGPFEYWTTISRFCILNFIFQCKMNKIIIQTLLLNTKVCTYYHPADLLQSSVVPYTLIQWGSCLQTDMTYLITRINRIQDASCWDGIKVYGFQWPGG